MNVCEEINSMPAMKEASWCSSCKHDNTQWTRWERCLIFSCVLGLKSSSGSVDMIEIDILYEM